MLIKFNPVDTPAGKLADVELHFTPTPCPCAVKAECPVCHNTGFIPNPLEGLRLIGFALWERRGGSGYNVTFPARQYSVNGERRSFTLLRPITDATAQEKVRALILEAYTAQVEQSAPV